MADASVSVGSKVGTAVLQVIPVKKIELDRDNPRIRKFLESYGANPNFDQFALALGAAGDDDGDTSTTVEKLKSSILSIGGIIQPIMVNKRADGKFVCVEGNTRLFLYKTFLDEKRAGNWATIPALVYEHGMSDLQMDAIRLQVHLVGTRPWEPRLVLPSSRDVKFAPKRQAFVYQVEALEAIKGLEYAAVFHEQGLGKTKIGVDLILYWLSHDVLDSAIVVTKKGLVQNWRDEIAAHSFLEPRLLDQSRRSNYYAFNSPARLYLTNYEVFRKEQKRLHLFLRTRRVGVLLDEAHKIKNPESAITKVFFDLAAGFKRRVIMTGTPVANRPYDIWAQVFFLDSGSSLGTDFPTFKSQLDLSNKLAFDQRRVDVFEEELSSLFSKIDMFCVRATKLTAGLKLPRKEIRNVTVQLEARQLELYEQFRKDCAAVVVKSGRPIRDEAEEILKRLLRLVQVASNPRLVDQSYHGVPGKLPILYSLIEKITDAREKAIIWTSFTENADWLKRELEPFNAVRVHGKMSYADRGKALSDFKTDPDTRVLVATPGAAKEGLTLTVANHAIFYDRSFSLDDYLQAQDRIHRISQTKTCFVTNIVAENTVDSWVEVLLSAKRLAAMLAQGDITRDQYETEATYTFGEMVRDVLGLEGKS